MYQRKDALTPGSGQCSILLMLTLFKFLWRKWKGFTHHLMAVQNWVLMAFTYCIAVAPVAICFKLVGRKLLDRGLGEPEAESLWLERDDGPYTMERGRHMS